MSGQWFFWICRLITQLSHTEKDPKGLIYQ